uniref:TFIIE beta domain-containing protein n=1 Tax=Haptolina ericina TaxID=156174 RepID=A0A7S3F1L1_9EUKA|mmetsp:Transcript_45934/g.103490  ORF Transcript_45934/g.103490 Transcript_45934/m.103490 type:complete len:312 (+) Transcript_45934:76-1011(+)
MSGAGGHNSVDAAMLRSMQKQAKFEEKEAKEQERKRERDTKQAAAAAPAKATKRMMTTKARKQMRTEAQRVEDPQLAQEHIFKVNGKQITLGRALYEIVGFLKARQDLAEAEFDEVRTATGISVETAPKLIQALDDNERVDMPDGVHGRKLRYRPPYGVRNAESLRHVLEQTYPSTGRGCETVKRSDLVGETYDGVARDIDKLCADGVCAQVDKTDTHGPKKDSLLFRMPQDSQVSSDVRCMWRESKVPKGDELQQVLVKRKELTQDELDERKARKDAANKARRDAEAASKKSRAPTFRKFTNDHLDRPNR